MILNDWRAAYLLLAAQYLLVAGLAAEVVIARVVWVKGLTGVLVTAMLALQSQIGQIAISSHCGFRRLLGCASEAWTIEARAGKKSWRECKGAKAEAQY